MPKTSSIGGMFGHEATPGACESLTVILPPHVARRDYAAARCGLRAAAGLNIHRVWLPSYLCEAMIEALTGVAQELCFYPVDAELQVSERSWIPALEARDLVVVIAYFGVRPSPDFVAAVRATSARVLIDAAACPPNVGTDWGADALLYSPRKLAGVPEGGILLDLAGRIGAPGNPAEAPRDWSALADEAFAARTDFDRRGACSNDRRWYHHQQSWEGGFPAGIWSMSENCLAILEQGLPWTDIAARRRANHATLAARLMPAGLASLAQRSGCPLGYVIAFDDPERRDKVRDALIAEAVYPPIHWRSPAALPASFTASRELAARILTLPCDQRYSAADMERIAAIVLGTPRTS